MLTPTQVTILKYLARDESYGAVARHLRMTPDGIKYHISQIRRLLNIKSLHAIIALAMVAGVLSSDQWPIEATGNLFIDLD